MKTFLVFASLFVSQAWAVDWSSQGGAQAYVGGQFGLSVPSESNTSARTGYGVKGGAKLGDNFGAGAYFFNSVKGENNSNYGNFNYAAYGLEADYYFDGSGTGGYIGGNVGLTKVTVSDSSGNSYSFSPFVWGGQGGYDYMITPFFSLGLEAQVLFISSGDTTTNNQSQHLSSFTALNFLAQAKFWF